MLNINAEPTAGALLEATTFVAITRGGEPFRLPQKVIRERSRRRRTLAKRADCKPEAIREEWEMNHLSDSLVVHLIAPNGAREELCLELSRCRPFGSKKTFAMLGYLP